ncbi:MAG: hypothetical protein JWR68_213 [Polaromonas sp.]|nr:hypothetical protein [Polaromonas sp.]
MKKAAQGRLFYGIRKNYFLASEAALMAALVAASAEVPALLAAEVAAWAASVAEAAEPAAAEAAPVAAAAAASAEGAGTTTTEGAGVAGTATSSFLLQAARARAATMLARTRDLFILRSLINKKTISGSCQKQPETTFKLFLTGERMRALFHPALNYMLRSTSMKTLTGSQKPDRCRHAAVKPHYRPRTVAGKAGELLSRCSLSRSLRAVRRPTSNPATPLLRCTSSRSNTQPGLQRALIMPSADVAAVLRHSTTCDQVWRQVTNRACRLGTAS